MSNDIAALAALMASGDETRFRLRQGEITAVASDNTCTVTIAGDTDNPISEVNYASTVCPVPGAGCWIATDGEDLFVVATIAPYGPAWGNMRRAVAQSIPNQSWTNITWAPANVDQQFNYGTVNTSTGIQVLIPGLWAISATPTFASSSSAGIRSSILLVNGVEVWRGTTGAATALVNNSVPINGTLELAIGDIVNFQVYQSSGGSMNTNANGGGMILNVRWIGPSPV